MFFGLGSSLKYGCASISAAVGLFAGFRDRREERRSVPEVVRKGNLARMTEPVVWGLLEGRRSERALGRRLKPGQLVSVGIPQSSKIWTSVSAADY